MNIEDWNLESKEPTELPTKRYWTFRYKNYSQFKIVTQDIYNEKKGPKELIDYLHTIGLMRDKYVPNKQLIKEHYEDTERAQTFHKMNSFNLYED